MKSHQWYCGVAGEQYGPFPWDQMQAMAAEGRIVNETYVRRDIDEQWYLASRVPGLLPKQASRPRRANSSVEPLPAAGQSNAASASRPTSTGGSPDSSSIGTKKQLLGKSVTAARKPARSTPSRAVGTGAASAATPADYSPPLIVVADRSAANAEPAGSFAALKRRRRLRIVTAVASVLLVTGVAVGGLAVWGLGSSNSAADLEVFPPLNEVNSSAAAAEGEERELRLAVSSEGGVAKGAAARQAHGSRLIAAQPSWLSVARVKAITLGKMRLEIDRVWLAVDAEGAPAVLQLPQEAGSPPSALASDARYVFVELKIANTAAASRLYPGWNAAPYHGVLLADHKHSALPFVPPSATLAVRRLNDQFIPAGGSMTDVLVFAAPEGPFERLHLLLEKSRLVEGARGHFALEIPLEVLVESPAATSASTLAERAEPSATSPRPPDMRARAAPPSKEELDRQIQALLERDEQPAKKE